MALFSRRPKPAETDTDTTPGESGSLAPTPADDVVAPVAETGTDAATAAAADADPAADPATDAPNGMSDDPAAPDAVPQVGISTSSFGGFGGERAEPTPPATGEAPAATETLPGLPDNVLLQAALADLGAEPETAEVLNVARQLLQGNVYLRVQGDAQALLSAGEDLPLAVATRDDGQFVMLFSGGAALAAAVTADGDTQTSAMGQNVQAVLEYVLRGEFAGIIIDQASAPAAVVLPRALIGRAVEEMDPALTLKHLLAAPRTSATAAAVVEALTTVPLWIAVNRASEDEAWGVAESRTASGERTLEVFSHPLEVVALGRGDQPMPFTAAQLGTALASDEGISGVVVDPAGPWIRLSREELGEVVALAEE